MATTKSKTLAKKAPQAPVKKAATATAKKAAQAPVKNEAAPVKKDTTGGQKHSLKSDIQSGYKELVQKAKTAITKKLYSGATAILEDLLEKLNEREKSAGMPSAKPSAQKNQSAEKDGSSKEAKGQPAQKPAGKQAEKQAPEKAKPSAQKASDKKSASTTDKKQSKQAAEKPARVSHGKDMHFIPQKNQQHLIKGKEKLEVEKAYEHNEEIALHQEQQKVKNNLATRQKRIFTTPRQS